MCRKCDVRGEDAGNPNIICHRIVQQDIMDLVEAEDHERLGELNQYCVDNAWYKVNFDGKLPSIFVLDRSSLGKFQSFVQVDEHR